MAIAGSFNIFDDLYRDFGELKNSTKLDNRNHSTITKDELG